MIRKIYLDIVPRVAGTNPEDPATPPKEFRLFRKGVNSSEKGDFTFDDAAAESVMEKAAEWGNRYPFDYCHMMLASHDAPDPAEAGKAAGWFTPQLRDGELWACEISWTAKAASYIACKEYVYFSPAFNVDGDDRVQELTNVALTNLPAMHDINQLVAASTSTPAEPRLSVGKNLQPDARVLSRMTKAKMMEACHALHSELHGKMHDEVAHAHLQSKMDEMSMDELKSYHAKLSAHMPPKDDGEPDGDEAPAPKEKEHASAVEDKEKEDKEHSKGASFAVVLSRIAELEKELAASKAEKLADSRQVVLSQGVREGKLSPAEAKGEGTRGKFVSSLSLSQLNDYLAACEPLVSRTETAPAESGSVVSGSSVTLSLDGETKVVTLSDEERAIAKFMGNSTQSLAKTKARLGV